MENIAPIAHDFLRASEKQKDKEGYSNRAEIMEELRLYENPADDHLQYQTAARDLEDRGLIEQVRGSGYEVIQLTGEGKRTIAL